jgi:hypothetical protein
MDTTNIEGTVPTEYSEFWRLFTRIVRTGLLKPRRRAMCRRIMIEAENYDESLLTVFNEIIKRLDWI